VDEDAGGKIYDGRILRRLVQYLKPYRKAVFAALALLLLNSAAQVLGPLLTKTAIDKYLVPADPPARSLLDGWLAADPWIGLAQISLVYLAAIALGALFEFGQTYLMVWTGQRAMFDLRKRIFAHLQHLDIRFFDHSPVGRLVTRVTTDVDALNELFSSGLVTILADLLMLSFIVAVMLKLSPGMTLLMLAILPLVVWVTVIFRRSVSASYRRTRVAVAKINSFLQEHVSGIAVLQLFNREARARDDFDKINREHMDAFKDAIFAYGWFYPVVEFLSMLALALLLSYGGWQAERGEVTLGVVVAFFQYGLRFFRPIQDLSEKYNILQSAMAAAERVLKLLDTAPEITAPASAKAFPQGPAAIEFDHVWFAYKEPEWVLKDVSFRIEPGETVAVVGHTGAGKTTLISLLLRFYDVQRGAIRIGGVDLREMDPVEVRSGFGVVLQDPYLFTGTLAENVRLGTDSITDERIRQAAEQVNLLDYVEELPDGFGHTIRERGAGLSTGEKQLVSFARALAHDPRFLILDEATSSVDTETEAKIREALDRLVAGRTSIIIAHRLSTIQRADRILVMHKGELRESGTHQELLALRGLYRRLYELQYKDQELRVPAADSQPVPQSGA
jgi:ATP-binding cassette subfamily B multidrug efflux pump